MSPVIIVFFCYFHRGEGGMRNNKLRFIVLFDKINRNKRFL